MWGKAHLRLFLVSQLMVGLVLSAVLTLVNTQVAGAANICVNPGGTGGCFTTIQAAINSAGIGDNILIAAGTYTEQLDINKSVTLAGAGAGSTVIVSPDILTAKFTRDSDSNQKPVVYVHDTSGGLIQQLTVDGANKGAANATFYGIVYQNASGTISKTHLTNLKSNPFDSSQSGYGFFGYNTDQVTRLITFDNNTVDNYQKNGIDFRGLGLIASINGNTITGAGPTDQISQNGIVLYEGAIPMGISGNTVSNNFFTRDQSSASVGLLYVSYEGRAGFFDINNNNFVDNQLGISLYEPDTFIIHNNNISSTYLTSDSYESKAIEVENFTNGSIVSNNIVHNTDGIEVFYGYDADEPILTVNFNRIAQNLNSGLVVENSISAINAENNWWGCNAGPNQPSCDKVLTRVYECGVVGKNCSIDRTGILAEGSTTKKNIIIAPTNVDFEPWLVLGFSANPTTVTQGDTSQLAADMRFNSDNANTSGLGTLPPVPANFSATNGTVSPAVVNTVSGVATSAFSGADPGAATASVQVDSQILSVDLLVLKGKTKNIKVPIKQADLVGQLRVTPDREFNLTGGYNNLLTYSLKVKNIGQGAASVVTAKLPVDDNLVVGYATIDPAETGVWVQAIVTDVDKPYVQIAFPVINPGEEHSLEISFRAKEGAGAGAIIFTRAALGWNDAAGSGKSSLSNGVRLNLSSSENRNETGGEVQLFTFTNSASNSVLAGADFFIPDELVDFWFTDENEKSTPLGQVQVKADGTLSVEISQAPFEVGKVYTIAGRGGRSEITGAGQIRVVAATGSANGVKTYKVETLKSFNVTRAHASWSKLYRAR